MSQQTPDDPDARPDKDGAKLDLSWPKIFGGALAAVTTAVMGSQLGVAGTIVGAAIASIVGAVAGSLYTVGLDRTHRTFTSAVRRGIERVRGQRVVPEAGATAAIGLSEPAGTDEATTRTRAGVIRNALVATAATLGVALVSITVLELVVGRSLDGSEGTSVSQVVRPRATRSPSKSATPTPSATPTRTSVTPTPTPTAGTTSLPTATATTAPTATATASTQTTAPTATSPVTTAATSTPAPTATGSAG